MNECGLWIAGIVPVFLTDLPSSFQELLWPTVQDVGIILEPDRIVPVPLRNIL